MRRNRNAALAAATFLAIGMAATSSAMADNLAGIELGMSPIEVRASIMAQYPKAEISTIKLKDKLKRGESYLGVEFFTLDDGKSTGVKDVLTVHYLHPIKPPTAWAVVRDIDYQNARVKPNLESVVAAHVNKFGEDYVEGEAGEEENVSHYIWGNMPTESALAPCATEVEPFKSGPIRVYCGTTLTAEIAVTAVGGAEAVDRIGTELVDQEAFANQIAEINRLRKNPGDIPPYHESTAPVPAAPGTPPSRVGTFDKSL